MSLGLRSKFLVGFGGLLLILLGFVVAGFSWLSRMGSSVDTILRENYRSVVACQQMKESLERLDSGALFSLLGYGELTSGLTQVHQLAFEEAYAKALSNVTLAEEGEKLERVGDLYRDFRSALAIVTDDAQPAQRRREAYTDRLLPVFREIKDLANEILDMNQENMVVASVRARELALRGQQQFLAMAVAGILSGAACVLFLSRTTLVPIRRLTASVREIEKGNFQPAVETRQQDEVGELTRAFNSMAESIREYRRVDQAKLVRTQKILSLTIDSLPDAVFLLSPQGQVELTNRAARTVFSIHPNRALPEAESEWLQPLLLEAQQSRSAEASLGQVLQRFIQGEEQFHLPMAVAIRDDDRELVGVTVVLANVTHLRRLDEMKNNMLATVSHELLTPITSLEMALNIMHEQRYGELTPRQRELVAAATQDVDRLQRMIDDLLDVSRLNSGKVELNLTEIAIGWLIDEAVGSLKSAFEQRQVQFDVFIDPAIKTVQADRGRTPLIFSNLLSNALKNTPPGGQVTLEATRLEDWVRFSVRDTGRGIPDSELESIFERFHRTPGSGKGVGLGLAIARQLVEAHGGQIECSSTEGIGSCFTFDLPLAAVSAARTSCDVDACRQRQWLRNG